MISLARIKLDGLRSIFTLIYRDLCPGHVGLISVLTIIAVSVDLAPCYLCRGLAQAEVLDTGDVGQGLTVRQVLLLQHLDQQQGINN